MNESTLELFKLAEYQSPVNAQEISKLLHQKNACPNCKNQDLHTPLHVAIIYENKIVINALLKTDFPNSRNIYNGLLLAISRGSTKIAEDFIRNVNIYNKIKVYQKEKDYGRRKTDGNDIREDTNLFMVDVTPIMLASQKNQLNIVRLLWERDERIIDKSDSHKKEDYDELKVSRTRLNTYRALASDAYLCVQFRNDPFYKSFQLSRKMEQLAATERHFRVSRKSYLFICECLCLESFMRSSVHACVLYA